MGPDRDGLAEDMSKAPTRHCARLEVISIQTGTSLTGKKTPARKISGKIRIWIRTWKPCCDCMNEAIRIPRPESASDKMITTGISFSTIVRDADDGCEHQHNQRLQQCNDGPTGGLSEHDPGAAEGRDEDLLKEAIFAVPDDRDARKERAGQGHGLRVHERLGLREVSIGAPSIR